MRRWHIRVLPWLFLKICSNALSRGDTWLTVAITKDVDRFQTVSPIEVGFSAVSATKFCTSRWRSYGSDVSLRKRRPSSNGTRKSKYWLKRGTTVQWWFAISCDKSCTSSISLDVRISWSTVILRRKLNSPKYMTSDYIWLKTLVEILQDTQISE